MPSDNLNPQSTASQIRHFMLRSATTGQGLTTKTHSDFSGKYNINGGTEVTLSFSAGTVGDAYSSGKIVPLGLGKYAWHVPDALYASVGSVSAVLACADAIDVHFDWAVAVADRAVAAFGANTVVPTNLSAAQVRTELATELARIDVAISTRSTFAGGAVASVTDPVTVGTNNDKTGYALTQAFPANFAALGVNVSGHVERVVLVDTTTTNTDMRGTDDAMLAASYTAPDNADITAIKTKTDQFVFTIANQVDSNALSGGGGGGLDAAGVRSAVGLASANLDTQLADVPTVAEFEARTLPSAGYFDAATDTVANVTLVATTTTNTDMRGTDSALLAASYIAPANADIAAILVDTDATIPGLISTLRGADADTLKTLSDQIDGIAGGAGTGARTVTITVTDGTNPLQNATVRMSEGVNTYTALTSVSGVAVFNLDDATYVLGVSKSGYSFAGASLLVDGAEAVTYAMTQVSVSPPADPALCAVTIPIVNQQGVALVGEPVEIRFNAFADSATTTALVLSPPPVLVSDVDGRVIVELLRLASYSVFYGATAYKRRVDVDVPDAASFVVGE